MIEGHSKRRPWVAVVLALFNGSLAMLYLGRPRRAGGYVVATLMCPVTAFVLARSGSWPAGQSWFVLVYLVAIVGILDTYRIAKWHQAGFAARWFTTWKSLIGIQVTYIVLVIAIRVFLFEPFVSPSAAMLPTVHEGDQVFVSKLAFRGVSPRRGDVVIFRVAETGVAYLKRVIGLPGDVVICDPLNDGVTINGGVVGAESLGAYSDDPSFDLVRETIDGRPHSVLHLRGVLMRGGTYRVPESSYFVLGDNRDNSSDSRYENFGFIPAASILGKVTLIWWNDGEPQRAGIVPE